MCISQILKEMIFISKYKIVYKGASGEIIVKKSRFIATIEPVDTEEKAIQFIERMKKKYYNASHNCTAYIIGQNNDITRCNDDGEPSRTAGFPMLNVLQGEGLHNVVAVVTRYFGGTLLGTGGLVRAYQDALKEGLNNCIIIEKQKGLKVNLNTDYTSFGKIEHILTEEQIPIVNTVFTDTVDLTYLVPIESSNDIENQITEATSGQVQISPDKEIYFAIVSGEILFFDS